MTSARTLALGLGCLLFGYGCAVGSTGNEMTDSTDGPPARPSSDGPPSGDGTDDPPAGALSITSPASGSVVGSGSLRIEGRASLPDGSVVQIGDLETTVAAGAFAVPMELDEGAHRIEATAAGASDAVDFTVDATPPDLVIDSPAQAAFVDADVLRITGRVEDDTECTLLVGGEPVSVGSDGHFSWEQDVAPGAQRVRLVAMDAAGHTDHEHRSAIVGDFAMPGAATRNAVALELGRDALSELGRGVAAELSRVDLEGLVAEANPVASGWWGELSVVGLTYGDIRIAIEPRSGRLIPRIVVDELRVDLELDWSVGGATSGYLTADPEMVATVDPGVRDGLPEIGLRAIGVALHGFSFDVEWVPSWFEDWDTVRDSARSYLEDRLRGFAEEHLPPKLEDALSDLPTGRRVSFEGGSFDVGVELAALDADPSGLWAAIDVTATAAGGAPSEEAFGPLVLPSGDRPPYRSPDNVAVHVSQNLLNSVLYEAWLERLMDRRIASPTYEGGGVRVRHLSFVLPGLADVAPPDSPVDFEIAPALPPVVRQEAAGVRVDAADVRVDLVARVDGSDVPLMTVSLGATARVTPQVADDELSASVGGIELTGIDVIGDAKDELPAGPELEELLLALIGDRLEDGMEIGALETPALYGFDITAYSAAAESGYIGLTGGVEYRD